MQFTNTMKHQTLKTTTNTETATEISDIYASLNAADRHAFRTYAGFLMSQQMADPLHGLSIDKKLSMLSHDDFLLVEKIVDHYSKSTVKPTARRKTTRA